MSLWQYQVKAEPVFTGSERTSPDKYIPQDYYPRRSFARNAAIAAVVLASSTALAFTPAAPFPERTSIDKWHPVANEPRWEAKSRIHSYPSLFFSDTGIAAQVSADAWRPRNELPRFDIGRRQYLYPHLFYADIPRAESVSVDRWHPVIEQPRRSVVRPIFESGANNPYPIPNPVTTVPFDWLIQNAEPFRPRPRVIVEGSAFVYPVAVVVTPFDWQCQQPEPMRRRAALPFDLRGALASSPVVPFDWQAQQSIPVRPRPRILKTQFEAVGFTPVVPFDWFRPTQELTPGQLRQRVRPVTELCAPIVTQGEYISVDKYDPQIRYRFWPQPRRDYLYTGVVVELAQPNAVFVDSWIPAQIYIRQWPVPLYWIPYGEVHRVIPGVNMPCILQADAILIQPVDYDATLIQPVGYCAEEIACE